ncbi:MAG TPA: mechanosensitive ion channel, partial [Bacteroidia bacterium]|nr:mechanosensitive ion channel [Bacteroidia bacterium]
TILLTPENKTVILANGAVSNGTIVNYSKHGNMRVDLTLAVTTDANLTHVRKVALDTMAANDKVLKTPEASVNVLKIGDGMITLAIRPFCTPENYWDVFFSVQEDLKTAFENNNIAGPTPTRIIINK